MPTPQPEELPDLFRTVATAPEQPDSFFATLGAEAAAANVPSATPGRTRRVAITRLGAVIAGATLVVSGGAMASAIFFDGSDRPSPGRIPDDPTVITDSPKEPASQPSAPGLSLPADPADPQVPADPSGPDDSRPGKGNAGGTRADGTPGRSQERQGNSNPNNNGNGNPNSNGNSNPNNNGNGNPNSNGNANPNNNGNDGSGQGPGQGPNAHANERAQGSAGHSTSRPSPQGNAHGHEDGQGSEAPKGAVNHHREPASPLTPSVAD